MLAQRGTPDDESIGKCTRLLWRTTRERDILLLFPPILLLSPYLAVRYGSLTTGGVKVCIAT
jgi:hypothetical protein